MARPIRDPRLSNRWFGPGAIGRFLPGPQSVIPKPRPEYQPRPYPLPSDFQSQPKHIDRWEELTPTEQGIMDRLPGIADNAAVRWLTNISQTKAGHAIFTTLDSLAEGLERGTGTLYQFALDPQLREQVGRFDNQSLSKLGAAWKASSLFYDTIGGPFNTAFGLKGRAIKEQLFEGQITPDTQAELDEFERRIEQEQEHWGRVFKGLDVDTGGLPELIEFRQRIFEGEDLDTIRQEHIESLGALAIRSQIWDAVGHVALDPLNFLMPKIKPIERLTFLRNTVKTSRVAEEVGASAADVTRALDAIESAGDLGKVDDLVAAASKLDIGEVSQAATQIQEGISAGRPIAELGDSVAAVRNTLSQLDDMKHMTRVERGLYWLTGGDPLRKPEKTTNILGAKLKVPADRIFPWKLTPMARAQELVNVAYDNTRFILSMSDDPVEWVGYMKRAAAGAFGGRLGHMVISPQGRHFQGVLKAWSTRGDDLLRTWGQTENHRNAVNIMARIIGTDPTDVVGRLQKGGDEAKALLDLLADSAGRIPAEDAAALQLIDSVRSGEVGVGRMLEIGQVLRNTKKNVVPYTADMFRGALVKQIAEDAANLAKVQFGIKQAGFVQKMTDAVKAAESLVLLGLNPKYPVQNFLNNNVTAIARGTFGHISLEDSVKYLESFGPGLPARAREGFTIAGERIPGVFTETDALRAARGILREAQVGEAGWLDRVTEGIRGIKSPVDFRRWSGNMESAASLRAYTVGMMKAWREVWTPGKGFSHMDDFIPGLSDALRQVDPGLPDYVNDALKAVRNPADLEQIRFGNFRLNEEHFFSQAAEAMGVDAAALRGSMGDEIFESLRDGLKGLGDNPTAQQIDDLFDNVAAQSERHIDDIIANELPLKVDEYAVKVATEGPEGVLDIYDEISQLIYGRRLAHFRRIDGAIPDLLKMDDKAAGIAWTNLLKEGDRGWGHTYDFADAAAKGIKKGWKEIPDVDPKGADNFLTGIRKVRTDNQAFINLRNKTWQEFFDDIRAGKFPDLGERQVRAAEIYDELDGRYFDLINDTDLAHAQMDELFFQMAAGKGEDVQNAVKEWRGLVRDLIRADMQDLGDFRRGVRGVPGPELRKRWHMFSKARIASHAQIAKLEQYGKLLFGDDPEAINFFLQRVQGKGFAGSALSPEAMLRGVDKLKTGTKEHADFASSLANRYGIATATEEGKIIPHLKNIVNKYLRGEYGEEVIEGATQVERFDDVPARTIIEALEARAASRGDDVVDFTEDLLRAGFERPQIERDIFTIPDINQVVSKQIPYGLGLDEMWFEKSSDILGHMRRSARDVATSPAVRYGDLPPAIAKQFDQYVGHIGGQLTDARVAANGIAGAIRDSALLNYTRTYNYDSWLSIIAPFEFWFTHSIGRWALHSIDRPAMLGTYFKMQEFMSDVIGDRSNLPSRLKGRIKIPLPFAPPEMGNIWLDPFRSFGLPFDQFFQPFVRWQQSTMTRERRAERKLEEMLANQEINTEEYNAALTREGPLWERVIGLVQDDDASSRFDLLDFMNLSASAHLPISAAWNVARGTPEDISVLPHTRTLKSVAGLLGVNPGVYNSVWGNIRKAAGLPAFDKWDEYRIGRELSNMAAEGKISAQQAHLARINQEGDIYEEAMRRVDKTLGVNWFVGMLGLPIQPYPEGEEKLRELYDEFYAALEARDNGEPEALTAFFDENPEFETRLALWKSPEEQLQTFLVDNIWTQYNNFNSLDRRIVRDALGEDFQRLFLDSETKQPDNIPVDVLGMWLKMMGGETPGTLGEDALPITTAPAHISNRAQIFYDYRNTYFPNYFELQKEYFALPENEDLAKWLEGNPQIEAYWAWRDKAYPNWRELQDTYFALPEGQRRAFLNANPDLPEFWDKRRELFPDYKKLTEVYGTLKEGDLRTEYLEKNDRLREYWNWRSEYLNNNPDVAPYLDDNFQPNYETLAEAEQAFAGQPTFTWNEWTQVLDISQQRLLEDYFYGEDLPEVIQRDMEELADNFGVDVDELLFDIENAYNQAGITEQALIR